MQISIPRTVTEPWLLVGGGLCLSLLTTLVIYVGNPLYVPLIVAGAIGGVLVALYPALGLFGMLSLIMFKPDFAQGAGLVTLIAAGLAAILGATVAVGKDISFLRVPQVRLLLFITAVILVNWYFLGQSGPPVNLSRYDLGRVDQSGRVLTRMAFQMAFVVFFVSFIKTPRQILYITALFFVGILITIPGAVFHSAKAVAEAAQQVDKIRAAATVGIDVAENANYLAFLSLMAVSMIWFGVLELKKKFLFVVGSVAILGLVFTVFLSGSRSGLLMLLVLAPLLLLQSGLRRGQIAALALFLVIVAGISVSFVPERVLQRITSLSIESDSARVGGTILSLQKRIVMAKMGFRLFEDNPFMGVGVGNVRWMTALDPLSEGIPMTLHSSYILALAEGGIVLLAAYLLLFWRTYRDLGQTLRWSALAPQIPLRWLILATRTNLVLLLVFSFFAETWKEFYYLLILAITAVMFQLYRRAAEQSWLRSRSST